MFHRHLHCVMVSWLLLSGLAGAAEVDGEKVLDRFVGVWRTETSRKGPEAPQGGKLTSHEVIAKSLKGRYLIGREWNPQSHAKVMWFMSYDPQAKNYAWTFFNTQGLLGTEWKGTWQDAASTLNSKSSDAPSTWTSEAVNRFVNPDSVEGNAWMKDDKGKFIFEMSLTKSRLPADTVEKTLAAWNADATPEVELSPPMKVLHRLAGTWDVTSHSKKAEWTPEEQSMKSNVVRSWVLNRHFLQDTSTSQDGSESISLFTYDTKRSEYRSWWFSSAGFTSKSTGQWDAASNSMQMKSTLPEGQMSVGSVHFTDEDHHEWKILITDAAGKVYFDCVWNCVRAKP